MVNLDQAATVQLLKAHYKAVSAGDFAKLRSFYAREAHIWHNFTDSSRPVDDVFSVLAKHQEMGTMEYEDQIISGHGNEYYSRHYFRSQLRDGTQIRLPIIHRIVFDSDGLIERLEEYGDSRNIDVSAFEA